MCYLQFFTCVFNVNINFQCCNIELINKMGMHLRYAVTRALKKRHKFPSIHSNNALKTVCLTVVSIIAFISLFRYDSAFFSVFWEKHITSKLNVGGGFGNHLLSTHYNNIVSNRFFCNRFPQLTRHRFYCNGWEGQ